MDVDDVEGKLSHLLSCLGTNDKEALVCQFQQVLGEQITPQSCAFFLDMNNWNLQAALGSYYDFGKSDGTGVPDECLITPPSMQFVRDVTIGEGQSVPPDTPFVKAWRVKNCGQVDWPFSTYLKLIEGRCLSESDYKPLPRVTPGEEVDVCVSMRSLTSPGVYQSRWQLFTPTGMPFGEPIWCIVSVEETGLLGITQQLAGEHFDQNPTSLMIVPNNPFIKSDIHQQIRSRHEMDVANGMDPTSCSPLLVRVHNETLRLEDTDPPASPNGSSALCQAVSIQWQSMQHQSSPVNIPTGRRTTPEVPPCTPSTPPAPQLNDDDMQT